MFSAIDTDMLDADLETTPLNIDDCSLQYPDDYEYEGSGIPRNAIEWPAPLKWRTVALLAFAAFTVTFNCISIFPIASVIVSDLNGGTGTKTDAVLLITIWELGEAAGPLLIAPLSERFGRQPIYLACHALFLCGTVTAALSKSMAVFVAARAFTGLTVASNVLNPAIIGDMFPSEQRGSAMSIVMMATLVGGNLGPALGGFISQTFCWRAVLWIGTSLTVVCELMFLVCFRETYTVPAPQIPREQVKLPLRSISFEKEAVDLDTSPSLLTTVLRPARLLYGSGVLACLALFGSIVFAFFYIISVTLPNILAGVYELSPTAVGTAFLANGVGSFIGIIISEKYLDKIYIRLRRANNGIGTPEHRLPVAIIGAVLLPLAVVLYGWCAERQLPLAILLISVALMRLFPMLAFVPLVTYIVDAFGLYSASAMSGVIVVRGLACALVPLATVQVTERFGYGRGFTVIGAVCLLLALIPVMILRHGHHWRQRCTYTRVDCPDG